MARHNTKKRKKDVLPYYSFAGVWLLCACILPLYRIWALLITFVLAGGAALDEAALQKARQQGITVLSSQAPIFETALSIHEKIHG